MGHRGYTIAGPLGTLLLAALTGCATHLDMRATSRSGDGETVSANPVLKFQRFSIVPSGDEDFVSAEDLQPGDILLTSARTFRSSAIQMLTQAPVSHAAVYIGDGKIAEAVLPDVRIRPVHDLLTDERVVFVLRHPDLTAAQARSIRDYTLQHAGAPFNVFGLAMHAPYGVTRKVCELPLMPPSVRDVCIRGVGGVFHVVTSKEQMFCSQLVLQAYEAAGMGITAADPRLMSPADILHMREGDVPSVKVHQSLRQVGYLKYQRPMLVALEQSF